MRSTLTIMGFQIVANYKPTKPNDEGSILNCINRYERQAARAPIREVNEWYEGYATDLKEKHKLPTSRKTTTNIPSSKTTPNPQHNKSSEGQADPISKPQIQSTGSSPRAEPRRPHLQETKSANLSTKKKSNNPTSSPSSNITSKTQATPALQSAILAQTGEKNRNHPTEGTQLKSKNNNQTPECVCPVDSRKQTNHEQKEQRSIHLAKASLKHNYATLNPANPDNVTQRRETPPGSSWQHRKIMVDQTNNDPNMPHNVLPCTTQEPESTPTDNWEYDSSGSSYSDVFHTSLCDVE